MAKPPKKTPTSGAAPGNPDLEVLRQLVALLDSSSATSIKLARGEASYEVSRGGPMFAMPAVPQHAPGHAPAHPQHGAPAAATPQSAAAEKAPSNLIDIKSPMVGTFYRSPEPGAESYVKTGSRIAPGQTLCIIEAMKIMNEIESEISGVVREVPVEDASPVEFGQVLFRVEPHV